MPAKKEAASDYRKTVRLPDAIHKAARIAAAHESCTVQDWVERAIKSRIEGLGLGVLLKPPKVKKPKR